MPTTNRLPELLIIGAMKSGTTSLYMELARRTNIFLAENKEPHCLVHDDVLTPAGRERYGAIYSDARPEELLCDASTGYSKLPRHAGVAQRAVAVLPEGFRVVYLVRDPVERALSHFRHDRVAGEATDAIDHELRSRPEYLDYSRYAMQLRPWVEAVGRERVKVVAFERFVTDAAGVVEEVAAFAGARVTQPAARPAGAYNRSRNKPVRNAAWDYIHGSGVYRRVVRPLLPLQLRLRLFRLLLPKSDPTGLQPSDATRQWLRQSLEADAAELQAMIGAEPLWPDHAAALQPGEPPNPAPI